MARDVRNVFVNVPFDDAYAALFDALVFAIMACGYRVRCALEADDSGDIRLDKLVALIRESPRSIHDLSRIELGENELPRFNMPFELGLAMGAKRFGSASQRRDRLRLWWKSLTGFQPIYQISAETTRRRITQVQPLSSASCATFCTARQAADCWRALPNWPGTSPVSKRRCRESQKRLASRQLRSAA